MSACTPERSLIAVTNVARDSRILAPSLST
ncbi:unnamed protein product [Staurois parvus]|uniref:Uncharacterized protein n=1 Tax=Staurois parvus TaxID=386267 RepID=A0ABN9FQY9_9NEOB|nr:unnamed protein product [Staurois parvus]